MAGPVVDAVDPLFAAIAKSLLLDPETLWKSMPDSSDVSTPGQQKKKDRRLAAIGLGATGVAGIGGLHALKGTSDEHKLLESRLTGTPVETKPIGRVAGKLATKLGPKKAAAAIGIGWTGLHGIELVGDTLAARAQMKELKQKKPHTTVSKAMPFLRPKLPHVQPENLVRADARARRAGLRLIGATGVAAGAGGGYAAGRHTYQRRKPAPTGEVAKDYGFRGSISKVDTDKHLVFGWASLDTVDGKKVVDLQDDWSPIDEIEASAYAYVMKSGVGGNMHQRVGKDGGPQHVSNLVESFVVTPEKLVALGLASDALPLGWWTGFKVHDEQTWADVKSGKLTGFSVHGTGTRKEVLV